MSDIPVDAVQADQFKPGDQVRHISDTGPVFTVTRGLVPSLDGTVFVWCSAKDERGKVVEGLRLLPNQIRRIE